MSCLYISLEGRGGVVVFKVQTGQCEMTTLKSNCTSTCWTFFAAVHGKVLKLIMIIISR